MTTNGDDIINWIPDSFHGDHEGTFVFESQGTGNAPIHGIEGPVVGTNRPQRTASMAFASNMQNQLTALLDAGFTRSEAMALLLTERGATSVTVEVMGPKHPWADLDFYESDEFKSILREHEESIVNGMLMRMDRILHEALASQMSTEDIDRIVDRVAKGE